MGIPHLVLVHGWIPFAVIIFVSSLIEYWLYWPSHLATVKLTKHDALSLFEIF